ncbi:hypothetical protein NLU13_2875 [Sarocladium strictum]|uniref:chitinase n=1 Tax=Sarocladium strictum TaxID=5046 RepID=A0AA39L9W5_SARSR|nr:hypothetical protein NLU13_2875 [Sarocladium strictum]
MQLPKSLSASVLGLLALLNGANGAATPSKMVASTYFAGFHANEGFPVSAMPWDRYNDVKYAFAETTPDGGLSIAKAAPDQLPVFVAAAHKHCVKARVSIGGWTGSRYWSTSIGSAANRTAFVKTCLDFVKKYNLDGFDIDWEYPNRQGIGCNAINKDDTANLLKFLQEVREDPHGKKLYLTVAASLFPWNDASGAPSKDLSGFAKVLDNIMLMNYDIWGPWLATGGPNAPLYRSCDARNNQGSAEDAVTSWEAAGVPASKLVLAVPAYAHGFSVTNKDAFANGKLSEYPPQNASIRFQGSSWDNDPPIDECGNKNPPGGTYTFWSLVTEAKFLDQSGNPAPGIAYVWSNCSRTPALYSKERDIWVSYDNARSFAEKGKFILANKLAGFTMYEAGGDYHNILVNSIRKATGMD